MPSSRVLALELAAVCAVDAARRQDAGAVRDLAAALPSRADREVVRAIIRAGALDDLDDNALALRMRRLAERQA